MKEKKWKRQIVLFVAFIIQYITAFSQITPTRLKEYVLKNKDIGKAEIKYIPEVRTYYSLLNYTDSWLRRENISITAYLLNILSLSPNLGLEEKDYQYNFIESYRKGTIQLLNLEDSIMAEIKLTDAAIHFFSDVVYGNTKPILEYNGLSYIPSCKNIPAMLANYLIKNKFSKLLTDLSLAQPEVPVLQKKIEWFTKIKLEKGFKEVIIKLDKIKNNTKLVIPKLYQLGIIDSIYVNIHDSILTEKIKEAQRLFNITEDGIVGKSTIQELNIPIAARLKQLNLSINYYRWLSCLSQYSEIIVVNIPASYLKVYNNNKVMLEMKVIVGKKSTPTHAVASKVNEVILYPYWHVPYSIATKELLPLIQKNPGYIDANNYQVMNNKGEIMDPYKIKWNTFNQNNFPYLIRQSTGCDNALGLLKLNFYNPFGAYLHDTPTKTLFKLNKRFLSHGCIRMEKPIEIGHLILKNNQIAIDTLEQKGCLRNQSPISIPADVQMPVIIWYNPAGMDSTGRLIFFSDVYKKLNWIKRK
ncbi:MAG TPA: L,D-transpeptidase family protein [Chitinophagaceae bacterium]|nr:L,D-transpeptidase family protein [Chitinophagaceae bacterium]